MKNDAIGIDLQGNKVKFDTEANWVIAIGCGLVSLKVPKSVTRLSCEGNHLKTLDIPAKVHTLRCDKDLFDYDKCKIKIVHIYYGE